MSQKLLLEIQVRLLTHHYRRNNSLPSLGDANFLVGLEDDVEFYRKSGYQLCGRSKRDLDESSSNAETPPKLVPQGNKVSAQQPSSY